MVPASIHSEIRLAPLPDPARQFLNSLSSLDADRVAELLCDDARLSTRKGLYAAGKAKIRRALMRWISSLYSIHCEPAVVYAKDDVTVIEARCDLRANGWLPRVLSPHADSPLSGSSDFGYSLVHI